MGATPTWIDFTKMHGLGNDFMVVQDRANALQPDAGRIRELADRRLGVGFDQLLLIQTSKVKEADIRYRIFNADGGEAEQCGNGMRCIARYLHDKGLLANNTLRAETAGGMIEAKLLADGQVRVAMGVPRFTASALASATLHKPVAIHLADSSGDVEINAVVLSLGNPHAVLRTADVASAPLARLGVALQQHALFPAGVNVGFMQLVDRRHISLRVYERGVGETLACGSGACAAAIAGMADGALDDEVTVSLPGGDLQVAWRGEGEPVWMIGPASAVYTGRVAL